MSASTLVTITELVMLATVVIWLAWDVAVVVLGGLSSGATESWTLYSLSKRYPIIPLLVGIVTGHIFGTMPNSDAVAEVKRAAGIKGSARVKTTAASPASFALKSATVLPDGRTVQFSFSAPTPASFGAPDQLPWYTLYPYKGLAPLSGSALVAPKTYAGFQLEYIGAYATQANGNLTWTANYLIGNPSQVITAGQTLMVDAFPSILSDRFGNATSAFTAATPGSVNSPAVVPLVNNSLMGPDGHTGAFARGSGGVTVYVSSSHGTDNQSFTAAQNLSTPYATIEKALSQLLANGQHGKGAAIEVLRGDTFTAGGAIQTGGQDAAHPFVIESYWNPAYGPDPGTRPVFNIDASSGNTAGLFSFGGGGTPATLDNVVIRGLDFEAVNTTSTTGKDADGFYLLQPGSNWTLDNVVVRNFNNNVVVESGGINGLNIIRCTVTGSWNGQGIYLGNITSPLISQCTIDDNGHVNADHTGANIFLHNIYVQTTCGPGLVWGNAITNGGSHGIQLRPGGVLAYNHLAGNAIAGFIGGIGGTAYKNVVVGSDDIDPSNPRGFGLAINPTVPGVLFGSLEFNVIANAAGHQNQAFELYYGENLKDGFIRHNTVVNGGVIQLQHATTVPQDSQFSVTNNIFDTGAATIYQASGTFTGSWYAADNNALNVTGAGKPTGAVPGSDAHSVMGPVTYQQSPLTPLAAPTGASPIARYGYYANAFMPKALAGLGSGAFDYYGATDYRTSGK